MWELVRSNKRKSIFLFTGMFLCLVLLGFFAGAAVDPRDGPFLGLSFAMVLWIVMLLVSYFTGDKIVLKMSGAKEVDHSAHPQLFNIVEEMKIAANLPAMPKIYIIPEEAPNAFATGRNPQRAAIAVTAGLLSRLNRDELQGVIAHEMSHVLNRDILFMTVAGISLGSIVLLSNIFLRGMFYSGSSSRYRSRGGKGGGQAALVFLAIAIVFAVLSPIVARLLYFAISRKREYLADATGVRLTRYPEGLASALEKISRTDLDLPRANKVTAALYIVNPLKKKGMKLSDLTATHPPISERVKILRSLTHGVNFTAYQEAFDSARGKHSNLIPRGGLADTAVVALRGPSPDARPVEPISARRIAGDVLMAASGFFFVTCSCGLKMKTPPNFNHTQIRCPKCGKISDVPKAA
ncbi:MAG: M48 family metallopeptidase [Deltaproteobacteria bacterium]|nr:M48 family metallopeptidase [Deltaproteobacteria bacterium]